MNEKCKSQQTSLSFRPDLSMAWSFTFKTWRIFFFYYGAWAKMYLLRAPVICKCDIRVCEDVLPMRLWAYRIYDVAQSIPQPLQITVTDFYSTWYKTRNAGALNLFWVIFNVVSWKYLFNIDVFIVCLLELSIYVV